jgi:hypothetical protein
MTFTLFKKDQLPPHVCRENDTLKDPDFGDAKLLE